MQTDSEKGDKRYPRFAAQPQLHARSSTGSGWKRGAGRLGRVLMVAKRIACFAGAHVSPSPSRQDSSSYASASNGENRAPRFRDNLVSGRPRNMGHSKGAVNRLHSQHDQVSFAQFGNLQDFLRGLADFG